MPSYIHNGGIYGGKGIYGASIGALNHHRGPFFDVGDMGHLRRWKRPGPAAPGPKPVRCGAIPRASLAAELSLNLGDGRDQAAAI
jgi:hypothetical protein